MIRPLYDRVVVRRAAELEKTTSGLYIPESGKEKPAEGVVLAVGAGRKPDSGGRIPLEVEIGDKILFGKYAGNEAELDAGNGTEKLVILREEEIMVIL